MEMHQRLAFLRSTLWLPRHSLVVHEVTSNSVSRLETTCLSRALTVDAVLSGLSGTSVSDNLNLNSSLTVDYVHNHPNKMLRDFCVVLTALIQSSSLSVLVIIDVYE